MGGPMAGVLAGSVAVAGLAGAAFGQPSYRIIDLTDVTAGPLGLSLVDAMGIADAGPGAITVGQGFEPVEGKPVGLRWTDSGAAVEVLPLLRPDDNAGEAWFAGEGYVLGTSDRIVFDDSLPGPIRIFRDPVAVRWPADGDPVAIESLLARPAPYALTAGRDMNASLAMVGWGEQAGGGGGIDPRGWLVEPDGGLTDLGRLTRPMAITNDGLVVGYDSVGQDKAWRWRGGELVNLHDHPSLTGVTSRAYDANTAGDIVGEAQFDISQPEFATVWRDGEPIHLLAGLGFGRPQGVARSINERGEIVGWWADLDGPPVGVQAFIMPEGPGGPFYRLMDLVPEAADLGWEKLQRADGINERGWIIGTGVRDGFLGHAFLLIPTCPADLDRDGELSVFDFIAFGNAFDAGLVVADFDFDGSLTIFDFLAFQSAFDAGCE